MSGNAYVVGHITIKDHQLWADYRSRVPATLSPWGAELVFRGIVSDVLAGQHRHTDTVVIRFADRSAALDWFASDAYQALIALRQRAADVDLVVFEA